MRHHHAMQSMMNKDVYTGPSTTTYSTSGTFTFIPTWTGNHTIKLWGGGGSGCGLAAAGYTGGGAGGQFAQKVVALTKGVSYTVVVAALKAGNQNAGSVGNDSTFASTTAVAKGGAGGTATAGGVGSTTGGVGDTVYRGGSGARLTSTYGGGGGGGAGSTGNGNDASAQTGGAAKTLSGGAGANGTTTSGTAGSTAGGGGSGSASSSGARNGGSGAIGRAEISW